MITRFIVLSAYLVIFFSPPPSFAHKLNLFVWAENGTIHVENSLSGGGKLVNGNVKVVNTLTGETIITGKSDDQGSFSFTVPQTVLTQSPPLDIIVGGSDGHQAHWTIESVDYGGSSVEESLLVAKQIPRDQTSAPLNIKDSDCLSTTELESLLDQHLEIKLAPIRKNISSLVNPPPTVKDIAGGVGYLVGLAGIVAWLQSRKKKK